MFNIVITLLPISENDKTIARTLSVKYDCVKRSEALVGVVGQRMYENGGCREWKDAR